jgi:diguanylate cyclase (GGDEF)-like protein
MSGAVQSIRNRSDAVDTWTLHRQLREHAVGYKASTAGNLFNAIITAIVFSDQVSSFTSGIAVLTMVILVAWRYAITLRIGRSEPNSPDLGDIAKHLNINAAFLGCVWGSAVGGLLATSTPGYQLFAAIIGSGMISAGSIAYRTRRMAATLYVLGCAPGCLYGLISVGTVPSYAAAALLAGYIAVLLTNIRIAARSFTDNIARERALDKSSETIQLLLNDYAEHGSDWLVELDAEHRIVDPSTRLAAAAQRPIETLNGKRLISLLDHGDSRDALFDHLRHGRPFRHVIVSLTVDGTPQWWSISGKAVDDGTVVFRGVMSDITAQRQAEEKVSYMAHYDGLTALPNRFVFSESMYNALLTDQGKVGLLYFDLDHFKGINDTLGHIIGDKLLRQVAKRLQARLDPDDLVARMGGDEFAVLVRDARRSKMPDIAASIIEAIGQPYQIDGHDVVIGASIGMTCAPDHADDIESLARTADLALYAAKARGRNCAVWFDIAMDEAAQERRKLETDLRIALSDNQMRLHYQPLVDAQTGMAVAYEALVRWAHPERGTVMPNLFIPVAEENGMIVQLGEWVIRQALDDLATFDDGVGMSINLSPAQMRSPSLLSTVMNTLARTGVDANRVCFEITESVLLHDTEANIETLHRLRALGIQIALDDFGTGYSSLNYLRSFPFDKIKIDRCFVDEIDSREDCRAIIRSIVTLANSLGMSIVAEGVERQEQVAYLVAEGCTVLQGFLYSAAVPAAELSDLRDHTVPVSRALTILDQTRRAVQTRGVLQDEGRKRA